jgi:7-cyano-7-deazaguanine synthase
MKNNSENIAVVALSGGLDSCVTSAIAEQNYQLALLHINYGQRTEKRELKSFNDISDYYDIKKRLVVDLNHLSKIGASSLTDSKINVSKADLDYQRNLPTGPRLRREASRQVPTSYVPFRNANILSACVSWAEVLRAKAVFIGAVFEDSSGYPDCRPSFFKTFEELIKTGTKPETELKIETPIIHLTKDEIVKKGVELKAPLHLTWSCYKNEDVACGECDSCALRLRGFQKAGVKDPITYKVKPIYL